MDSKLQVGRYKGYSYEYIIQNDILYAAKAKHEKSIYFNKKFSSAVKSRLATSFYKYNDRDFISFISKLNIMDEVKKRDWLFGESSIADYKYLLFEDEKISEYIENISEQNNVEKIYKSISYKFVLFYIDYILGAVNFELESFDDLCDLYISKNKDKELIINDDVIDKVNILLDKYLLDGTVYKKGTSFICKNVIVNIHDSWFLLWKQCIADLLVEVFLANNVHNLDHKIDTLVLYSPYTNEIVEYKIDEEIIQLCGNPKWFK